MDELTAFAAQRPGLAFRLGYSSLRAQYVVLWDAHVIVPTRAHAMCCMCGGTRAELHDGHAFTPDDASNRALKLCAALDRIYNPEYRTCSAEYFDPHFEDGSPKYGWAEP